MIRYDCQFVDYLNYLNLIRMQSSRVTTNYYQSITSNNAMGRSFINTSETYGDELRRSRIQNLPNYKKGNLGESINFVVVFQTIEIERLSHEVEVLRAKVKEYERSLFNAQNYQVQIRELTEKLFSYESERQHYFQQTQRLNQICEKLFQANKEMELKLSEVDISLKQKYESERLKVTELTAEIEKWKSRYMAAERSRAKELEDLRNIMENQRKSMIDREIKEMSVKFQNERSNLENQVRKLRDMLNSRGMEIDEYKRKCERYEVSLMELRNYESLIEDNENKIVLLNQEILRLNEVLRNMTEEIERYKKIEYDLNLKVRNEKEWEYQNGQLKSSLEQKAREVEEWRVRYSRLDDEVAKAKQMMHFNNELSEKLRLASEQIDRLNNVLRSKLDEIEQWKQRLSDKQNQMNKYRHIENEMAQYEQKYSTLRIENERMNGVLKSRLEEMEGWKRKAQDWEREADKVGNVERDRRALEDKYSQQIKYTEELKFLVEKAQREADSSKKYESAANDLRRENGSLHGQVERLNGLIRNHVNEVNNYKTRFEKIQVEIKDYQNVNSQIKDYEAKIVMLTQEIERLNSLVKTRNKEIEDFEKAQIEMHTKISHYKNYEVKISESEQQANILKNALEAAKRDTESWQNKYKGSDGRIRELEGQIFSFSQERDKLNHTIKLKNNELEEIRVKYSSMEAETRQISELQRVCQEQHNQIMAHLTDNKEMERKIKEYVTTIEQEQALSNELAARVIVLSAEAERKKGSKAAGVNSHQYLEMQQSYESMVRRVKSKDSDIEILTNKITHLETKCSNLMTEYKRLLEEAQKSYQESQGYLAKIEEYQDYARRIHILSAEIDRLTGINKGLEDDNKAMRLKYATQIEAEKHEQGKLLIHLLMAAEIESLRGKVDEREVTMDEMRKSILEPVRRV